MKEKINSIREKLEGDLKSIKNLNDLAIVKSKYLGKTGFVTELTSNMKDLSIEEKKELGKISNEIRTEVTNKLSNKEQEISTLILNEKLEKESVDISLPSTRIKRGAKHPMSLTIEKIEDLFVSMGYDIVSGPELETDEYCFERLNLPKGHPARDMQDSFYITEEYLLRTQTSSVQARYMMNQKEKGPIRILVPGKTYRREDDATHSPQFCQIEGLVIDRKENNVSLADLKGTLEIWAKEMLGNDVKLRFRPSYFPFTEPSYEVDVSCFKCHGDNKVDCSFCKNTGWLEVFAAGIVHPNVLRMNGYDPKIWGGFAFGPGWDRIAMFRYNVPDIRLFYQNDMKFLQQFGRRDDK